MAVSIPSSDRLRTLFTAAVAAVDPRSLIRWIAQLEGGDLVIRPPGEQIRPYQVPLRGRILLIGAGKGAGFLAQGLIDVCLGQTIQGVIVVPAGQQLEIPHVTVVYGEHPVPGEGSVRGAEAIFTLLARKQPDDLICFCLTGGASSLLVSPVEGVPLADKIVVNQLLLACGADIHEVNSVRKHLSRIKGGQLARHAFPNHIVSFVLSDVLNDDLSTIGSGPTVPDTSTFADVWEILSRYGLLERLPTSVHSYLLAGCKGFKPETPKSDDLIFSHAYPVLVGSNRLALEAAALTARALGFMPQVFSPPLSGDTTETARVFAQTLRSLLRHCHEPLCVLAGGETTVRVTGQGKGGRNQEFALVVAEELQNEGNWALLSAGTDGIDGPTNAAGAFVNGMTVARGQQKGLKASSFLKENDSYTFFATLNDLFVPGPTGTNVMDIKIALLWPQRALATSSS
jgi:hydroxypyruvate reductase